MIEKIEYDQKLWIELEHCEGKHFLLGNPHTFIGRIDAFCPLKNVTFCISFTEIKRMSTESNYWLKGYLSGNEPAPPEEIDGEDGLEYFRSSRYREWELKIQKFRETGEFEI